MGAIGLRPHPAHHLQDHPLQQLLLLLFLAQQLAHLAAEALHQPGLHRQHRIAQGQLQGLVARLLQRFGLAAGLRQDVIGLLAGLLEAVARLGLGLRHQLLRPALAGLHP